MDTLTTVFQFEIRYNHILNFSQIARKILSPYVRLAKRITLENQNTIEERIIFNFDDDDYLIIVNWDRILIKGQGSLSAFTVKNSPIQTPFFTILEDIRALKEFGSIQNVLFAVNYIKKLDIESEHITERFIEKTMQDGVSKILGKNTDVAIILDAKETGDEKTVTFGPYFGTKELMSRPIIPVNLSNLEDTDFTGLMLEYKHFKQTSDSSFSEFVSMANISNKIIERVWKTL